MRKLGSIGYEALGTDFVKIINSEGKEAAAGEWGELYSRGPCSLTNTTKWPERQPLRFRG